MMRTVMMTRREMALNCGSPECSGADCGKPARGGRLLACSAFGRSLQSAHNCVAELAESVASSSCMQPLMQPVLSESHANDHGFNRFNQSSCSGRFTLARERTHSKGMRSVAAAA